MLHFKAIAESGRTSQHQHSSTTRATEVRVETKRAYKAFRYTAKTTWSSARRGLLSAADKPNIVVGTPPEFKVEPGIWAPEDLLVGSVNTCPMLKFLAPAQARGLTPAGYESEAEGLLKNADGKTASPK